jgi:rubrerythrin
VGVADFVAELAAENAAKLERLADKAAAGSSEDLSVTQLLRMALRNELEASELAAAWMVDSTDLDAKLAYARQAGDEAKHYRWIEARLAQLGDDLRGFDPSAGGPSKLLTYLKTLRGTAERAAAGPFTREAIAVVRNVVFADFCASKGDAESASLYRDRIQPDEQFHHELGRQLLMKHAVSEEAQGAARRAAATTLEIAEEIQELARLRAGLCRLPGC